MAKEIKFIGLMIALLVLVLYGVYQCFDFKIHRSARHDLLVTPDALVFDRVPFGGTARKNVRIANQAGYPIRISNAVWSCGCMQVVAFQPTTLNPGESIEYTVEMRGDAVPATQKGGTIRFTTNSSQANLELPVKALEVYGVRTIPESVDFGSCPVENLPKVIPLRVIVNGLRDREMKSIRVQSEGNSIVCSPPTMTTDGDLRVEVTLKPQDVVGEVTSRISITDILSVRLKHGLAFRL